MSSRLVDIVGNTAIVLLCNKSQQSAPWMATTAAAIKTRVRFAFTGGRTFTSS